ncbi:TonB-dependent receptor [Chitinophaga japonensis]
MGQAQATTAERQGRKLLTLSATRITLNDVFRVIRKQTGMNVSFSTTSTEINILEKVDVRFNKTPLEDVMKTLLKNRPDLYFEFKDENILILKDETAKKNSSPSPVRSDTSSTVFALRGKVTDAAGNPIPGATVIVKGTQLGASTDGDGDFTLPGVRNGQLLQVRSVGYETREIPISGKSIKVLLPLDMQSLDETVVIAYGTTTRRLNTGNISSVKAEEIERQPVSNPLLALQGRVPGLMIQQSSGLSGGGITIQIQGQNSIRNGNDPFYVIDGVPYSSQLLPNLGTMLGTTQSGQFSGTNGNPLSFINPADIESIEILKDADATAIYGSRAANGAILITTKKGKAGRTNVNVNIQNGFGRVNRKLDVMNTQQYLEMRHEALRNDGITAPSATDYDLNGLWDTTRNTNWQNELIGGTSQYTDVQASVSGGNNNLQFLVGTGYHQETTVFPGNFDDKKGSLHFNISNTSNNEKFRLQLSGSYLIDNNQLPNEDLTFQAITLSPVAPALYNSDGSLNWMPDATGTSTFYNPLRYTLNRYKNKTHNLISNILLSYQIVPGLEIKSSFGYTNLQTKETKTFPLTQHKPENRPFELRAAGYQDNKISSWVAEPQIHYKRPLAKGQLEILIGATIQQNNSSGLELSASGFNSDIVLEDIKAASDVQVISTPFAVYKYNALFSRINYNLQNKYIINLTGRRDGSSRFGPENQFHNFGAIGAAWIFSEETFFKNKLSLISFGKLRGSYGTTGSDQIGDYQFMNRYIPINTGIPYQGISALTVNGLTNPYLQWEETKKLQIGLDIGIFRDRVLLNSNYYHNRSSNQLLVYSLPIVTGFNVITKNLPATIQNSGWEFSLSTTNIKSSDFIWTSNFNLTFQDNQLVEFPNLENSAAYRNTYIVGEPITSKKLYSFIGVDPESGLFQFEDNDKMPTFYPQDPDDRTVLVNTLPKYYGGFQNSFTYKGFQFDVLFQFVKQNAQNYEYGVLPGLFMGGNGNQPITVLDRWQKPGDNALSLRYHSDFSLVQNFNYIYESSAGWSDASFIRLKNASLSWQIPEKWLNSIHLQRARLYVQGQNLLTLTNYKGLDPETRSTSSLPPLRVITMGVQVTL